MVDEFCQCEVHLHCIVSLSFLYRRHQCLAFHPQIFLQRDEAITFFLQGGDDARQGLYGCLTGDAASIVEQDDVTVFVVYAIGNTLVNLVGCYARLPIVRVDAFANHQVVAA